MLDDVINALTQMVSPPLRAMLWKSILLALALIVVLGIALDRLIVHLVDIGGASVETTVGPHAHLPVDAIAWLLSIAASLGIIVGGVFLMPAVTAIVASFFADRIGEEVERAHYPADPPGKALPLWLAMWEGGKTALLAVLIYLCAVPLLLFAGFGAVIFFLATAYILSREYFELAAMRFRPPAEAKALRKAQRHDGLYRRPVHRGFRVDPDRQSGDAAVRHGADGACAQAADGRDSLVHLRAEAVQRERALRNEQGVTATPRWPARRSSAASPIALPRRARCLPRWRRSRIAATGTADRGRRIWSPPRCAA